MKVSLIAVYCSFQHTGHIGSSDLGGNGGGGGGGGNNVSHLHFISPV